MSAYESLATFATAEYEIEEPEPEQERDPSGFVDFAVEVAESRPRMLEIHPAIRKQLDAFYESKKIPHLIFHGASGTGKLTLVQDFIHRIYQGDKQKIKANVMTVNCSHGKGIKFIRDELKFFAKTNIQTNSGALFKTILLINAHHLTIDAQSALRRCIELFSYNTRFFIVLENKNKLLNPILSRFCEIYVPEYVDPETSTIVNLHHYQLERKYDVSPQHQEMIDSRLLPLLENRETKTAEYLAQVSEEFYGWGVSCLSLMDWFETHQTRWTPSEYANTVMCFHRIKTEFRCEKMLMFYMLDFVFSSRFTLPIV